MGYLWIGVLAGLAATPHCAGMCGAFPLHLSRGPGRRRWSQPMLYVLGKTLTYAFLGTVAGFAGHVLVSNPAFTTAQSALAYAAGAVLAGLGLAQLGLLPGRFRLTSGGPRTGWFASLCRHFLDTPGPGAALVLGALTGYLPCPITLALLAVAAASAAPLEGLALLAGLGVGTAPVLVGIGLSGVALSARWRQVGLRGAGALLVLLGLVTALRPSHLLCRALPILDGIFPRGLW